MLIEKRTNIPSVAEIFYEAMELKDPPQCVGIKAFELYFPKVYVSQKELEKYDNVTAGKYTIGLGQEEMGFCTVQEDIVSICMTVLSQLLRNYQIEPQKIGFVSVGTETLIDKSKSVKTHLMDLFGDHTDIEGVDVKNACYGGTQALFHAIDWVYANWSYTGRYAIAVMSDIALYEDGSARCTGGAGAFACLIAPDALISFERGRRVVHMCNVWDFYKPAIGAASEYAVVDGPRSLECYFSSLDIVYERYAMKVLETTNEDIDLSYFFAVFLHSPFSRHVRKSFGRMMFADYERNMGISSTRWSSVFKDFASNHPKEVELLEKARCMIGEERCTNRNFASSIVAASEDLWNQKCEPQQYFNRRIGNMYTSSLYAQLVAFFNRGFALEEIAGKRLLFFSYGSGAASALFSAIICPKQLSSVEAKNQLSLLERCAVEATSRLQQRVRLSVPEYIKVLKDREELMLGNVPYVFDSVNCVNMPKLDIFPGAYYLRKVDEKCRRFYDRID